MECVHAIDQFLRENLAHSALISSLEFSDVRASSETQVLGQIRRHDEQGVLKVHRAQLVAQSAFVENLQQDLEDVGMSLFYFIQQDNLIRATSYRIRQHTPFPIAGVAWRSTDQARDGVFFP